ncbi:hypothetical protein SAMN04488005_1487 [Yoonia tamlensis]|uniref:Uncharacterized protein n=1 Tax=Yoonia tamlensis TaxID=390270 RepID=A0A1I6GE43_9RHOB|nr:hypothetical protein SAMN04488005_1487 [Yoonia tamlensis]
MSFQKKLQLAQSSCEVVYRDSNELALHDHEQLLRLEELILDMEETAYSLVRLDKKSSAHRLFECVASLHRECLSSNFSI